jgi:hypothetical protein
MRFSAFQRRLTVLSALLDAPGNRRIRSEALLLWA